MNFWLHFLPKALTKALAKALAKASARALPNDLARALAVALAKALVQAPAMAKGSCTFNIELFVFFVGMHRLQVDIFLEPIIDDSLFKGF